MSGMQSKQLSQIFSKEIASVRGEVLNDREIKSGKRNPFDTLQHFTPSNTEARCAPFFKGHVY